MAPFRPYQRPVFDDRHSKIMLLHWSRQVGKSYTLAAWAVDRCLVALAAGKSWLVTVLSNSKDNGAEFAAKAAEWARKVDAAARAEELPSLEGEDFRFEIRLRLGSHEARVKVLPANPRTARGFSGDLILDEFAFHQDDRLIWDAAEPIISSNPEYLCRIASTGNGRRNLFYQMATGGKFPVCRWRRSDLWEHGWIKVFSAMDNRPITPDEARAEALDVASYDQNYECAFENEAMAWVTPEQAAACETLARVPVVELSEAVDMEVAVSEFLYALPDDLHTLYAGWDFARSRHQSVVAIAADVGDGRLALVGGLLMRGLSSTAQAAIVARLPVAWISMDCTGNGIGSFDCLVDLHGWGHRLSGLNFSTTAPASPQLRAQGVQTPNVPLPALLATGLAAMVQGRNFDLPADATIRRDLTSPQRVVGPTGRISVDAPESPDGSHCDWFWALALVTHAAQARQAGGAWTAESLEHAILPEEGEDGPRRFQARTLPARS